MANRYALAKGDLLLQSKHADASFEGGPDGWAMFFFDTPVKGKCLSVEWMPGNWPAVMVRIQANWKAKKDIEDFKKDKAFTERVF